MLIPRARRDSYRGKDKAKLRSMQQHNAYAAQIDAAVDRLYERQDARHNVYDFTSIAREAGLDTEVVRRVGFSNGSHSAITLTREDIPEG